MNPMIDPEQARKPLDVTPSKKIDETEIKTNLNSYHNFMKTAQNTKEVHTHVEEVKEEHHDHGHEQKHEEHDHAHSHDHGDEEANFAVTKETLNDYF